jgi:hypothetical protein
MIIRVSNVVGNTIGIHVEAPRKKTKYTSMEPSNASSILDYYPMSTTVNLGHL